MHLRAWYQATSVDDEATEKCDRKAIDESFEIMGSGRSLHMGQTTTKP